MKSIIQKVLFLFIVGATMSSCGCLKNCNAPSGAINPSEAIIMQEDYTANQHLYINSGLASNYPETGEDSREVWFSIAEIEQYICYAKKESLQKGVSLSGLRVYLASKRIPNQNTPDPDDFVPRTSVFFVPTHQEKSPIMRSVPENNGTNNKDTKGLKPLNMGDTGNGIFENTGG